MTTMKAMCYDRYGGPEVLEYIDRDKPGAGAGQILIHIRAASVNPIDWKLRSGAMKALIPLELPTSRNTVQLGGFRSVKQPLSSRFLTITGRLTALTEPYCN